MPLLNEGLQATAKHLSNSQALLEDEARAWDQGVLEDLKKQRDTLVSMRELFDRRDRYDRDNIPSLERRIQSNEAKLISMRGKPEGTVKPGDIEKVTEAIIKVWTRRDNQLLCIINKARLGQGIHCCPTREKCFH